MHTDQFLEHIIKYSEEWYNITSRKVAASLKSADKLRKELDHYESKVNRVNFEKARLAKNSTTSDAYTNCCTKLERNEQKMRSSKQAYEAANKESTALIEEVTQRCWKDVFPALLRLTQFDASLATDEYKLFKNLNAVSKQLTEVKESHKLVPETTRLQNIENFESQFRLKHLQNSWNKGITVTSSPSSDVGDSDEEIEDKLNSDLYWSKKDEHEDSRDDRVESARIYDDKILSARTVEFCVETDSVEIKQKGEGDSDTENISDEGSTEGAEKQSASYRKPPVPQPARAMLVWLSLENI